MKRNVRFAEAVSWLTLQGHAADQREVAERTGITETTLSRIMNNRVRHPSRETIMRFCGVYGNVINKDYLLLASDTMLMSDVTPNSFKDSKPAAAPSTTSDRMVELCASLAQDLESVRRTMADTLSQLRAELHEARRMNAQMRATLLSLGHNAPYPEDDTAPTAIAAEGTITNEGNSLTDKPIKTKKNETEPASISPIVSPPI
jgi:transcriptional regulator with XRE-family HTH domain